jgi:hypothetical protein
MSCFCVFGALTGALLHHWQQTAYLEGQVATLIDLPIDVLAEVEVHDI